MKDFCGYIWIGRRKYMKDRPNKTDANKRRNVRAKVKRALKKANKR